MSGLRAGFARADITPPLGAYIPGYFEPRIADGVLDPLYASAVAFEDGGRAVLVQLDVIGISQAQLDGMRENIARAAGLARKDVMVHCSHIHTGPNVSGGLFPVDAAYNARLEKLIEQAAVLALDDLRPATLLAARGEARGIAFVRRFLMKDGTTRTNPGYRNPEIDRPLGEPDEGLTLVRIVREGAPEILLVNFQVHPDVVTGRRFSADYPGFVRSTLEGALPGARAVYLNGAAGDLNHIDVSHLPYAESPEWDKNGGYAHAAHMGRTIAGEALRIYTKARPVAGEGVNALEEDAYVATNKGDPAQFETARNYIKWHEQGRDDLIPEHGMGITTLVAEAQRMLRLADGPDEMRLNLAALKFGGVCLAGIPGEGFTDIGRKIKAASPFSVQLVCGPTDGYEGYFPMREAYDMGGYEVRSSKFKPGVGETIAEGDIRLVNKLYGN